MNNTQDRTRTNNEEVTKLKSLVINSINDFRNANERYGYSVMQVNAFFEDLIEEVQYSSADGNVDYNSMPMYAAQDKAELYKTEYMTKANWLIDIINNVRFTQGFKGYDTMDVDNYLDGLIKTVRRHSSYENIGDMIDVDAIKDTKFHAGFRGYDYKDVDNFLDEISKALELLNSIKKKHS